MADPFAAYPAHLAQGPATKAFAIVPSDTVELPITPRALYIGTGGNLTLTLMGDSAAVLFKNVVSGAILDFRVKLVWAGGTVASDIVGIY